MPITPVGAFYWPRLTPTAAGAAYAIDAAAEKVAYVIRAPKTGTLKWFEFLLQTVTSAPGSGLRLSFQDVDLATGNPDGTQDQYRVVTSGLTTAAWIAPPGVMTSDGTDGGGKRSVTKGDLLACVVEFESFSAGNSVVVSGFGSPTPEGFPYLCHYTSVWTRYLNSIGVALRYDDDTYAEIPGAYTFKAVSAQAPTSATTPDEVGARFIAPVTWRVRGVVWNTWIANGNATIRLYDSADTLLTSLTVDKDTNSAYAWHTFLFPDDIESVAGEVYRVTVAPDTTNAIGVPRLQAEDNARLALSGGGADWYWTERTDGGPWTDRDAYRPALALIVDGISVSAGATGRGPGIQFVPGRARKRRVF